MKQITAVLFLSTLFSVLAYSQNTKPVDYSKRIKDATPKPLPQSPVAKKPTSDAQDDNLNGKVKLVIEEREGLTGVEKPIGRRTKLIADFDEQGNYLRRVNFEYRGKPYSVGVYGYIDGSRAVLYSDIEYADELFSIRAGDTKKTTENDPKPDPRFTYKYEYKFKNGKLSEMQLILNTGEKGTRYVYNYNGNQREYLAYLADDELNQKYLYIMDVKGNDIEMISFNEPSISTKYRIRYIEFDREGNWTKRTNSQIVVENGKETERLIAVEYRTITYYP